MGAHADLATTRPGERLRATAARRDAATPVRAWLGALVGLPTPGSAWRAGARGEALVGARLARLGPSWRVLHGIPLPGGGDIDHLVVGPGGAWTLNTKFHPRRSVRITAEMVLVDGRPTAYVDRARHEAARAAALLGRALGRPLVVGGLVVVVAGRLVPGNQPHGVTVLGWPEAVSWLRHRAGVLAPGDVARIYGVARRPDTWLADGPGASTRQRVAGTRRRVPAHPAP